MEVFDDIYGARIKVFIQYEGTLQDLGSKIEEGLGILLWYQNNEYEEPYALEAYAEVFGFEILLIESKYKEKWPDYHYSLEANTEDSLNEMANKRMYDISLWMARFMALTCEVVTMAENADKETGQSFYRNNTTSKTEISFVEAKK